MEHSYSELPNSVVSAANGIDYAYRDTGLIPQAALKIYPDSAHGFLFQHHAEFAADVMKFLD
jgi:pimeloyl-ACP methyl ester carboxylesterase